MNENAHNYNGDAKWTDYISFVQFCFMVLMTTIMVVLSQTAHITVSSVVSNQGIYTYQYYCVPKAAVIIGTTSVHELAPAWEVRSAVKISTSVYFM